MSSNILTVPKHLPRCLPSIDNVSLSDESINRIGGYTVITDEGKLKSSSIILGNYIELSEPVSLGLRLAFMDSWMEKLLNEIKSNLKYMFLLFNKK